MAQLKSTVVQGSLRVTDTTYTTDLVVSGSKTAKYVLAAPNAAAGAPTWRALANSDVGLGNVENTKLSTWAGTTNITTLGTIATGTWNATAIGATKGGTGQTAYTIGDILYSGAANTLSKLGGNTTTTRKFLRSVATTAGTAVAPAWDTVTKTDVGLSNVTNDAQVKASLGTAKGDMLYWSASATPARLAIGTAGYTLQATANGPAWTQTVAVANGGTGKTSWTQWGVLYASASTTLANTGAGTAGYLLQSNASSAPSWIQATNSNTASTIVKRDSSGNFSAGTITALLTANRTTTGNYITLQSNGTQAGSLELTTRGTTSAEGKITLVLGNNKTSTTAENASGIIQMYGAGNGSYAKTLTVEPELVYDVDINMSPTIESDGGSFILQNLLATDNLFTRGKLILGDGSNGVACLKQTVKGTSSVEGKVVLCLGNDSPSNITGNASGEIRLYNSSGTYSVIDQNIIENEAGVMQKVVLTPSVAWSNVTADTWYRCCKIKKRAAATYLNGIIQISGSFSTGSPTVATISVQVMNTTANIYLLHCTNVGNIKSIRLIDSGDHEAYWIEVLINKQSSGTFGPQTATLIGNIIATDINTTLTAAPAASTFAQVEFILHTNLNQGIATTASIRKIGDSVAWINGRNSPIIKTTSYTGYNSILSMKTTNGDWSLGVYSGDAAYLTYITDANYNSSTNSITGQIAFESTGNIYASGIVASKGPGERWCEAQNSTYGNRLCLDVSANGQTSGLWSSGYVNSSGTYVAGVKWLIYRNVNNATVIGDTLWTVGDLYVGSNGQGTLQAGNVRYTSLTNYSSLKIKENISPISEQDALSILYLNPVYFNYKEGYGTKEKTVGVIAEEVEKYTKYIVTESEDPINHDLNLKCVSYDKFIPYLIKLVQIQQREINNLKQQIQNYIGPNSQN